MAKPVLKIIIDSAIYLKTVDFLSSVKFLNFHIFNTFLFFLFLDIFLIIWIIDTGIFKHSFVQPIHVIPQTATVTSFRAPIKEVAHLLKFSFKHVNDEKISIVFSNFLAEFKFFKKNVESSAYAAYRYVF